MTTTLAARIEAYALSRDVSKNYVDQLRFAVDRFAKFLGRAPTVEDLTPDAVNRWIVAMQEEGTLSAWTIHSYRRHLIVIWNDAIEDDLTTVSHRKVRKVKRTRLVPDAWKPQEVRSLLTAADSMRGQFRGSGVERRLFWRAMILTAWDTGLRLGDLLRLRTDQVLGRSEFRVVQHKNRHEILLKLRPETVEAIAATYPPERELVFAHGLCRQKVFVGLRAIVKQAGVPKGGFHKIRKASATAVEIATPGGAMQHLGHLTPDLAYRHYVDRSQLEEHKPLAPALLQQGGAT